jgi:hypothetical protein
VQAYFGDLFLAYAATGEERRKEREKAFKRTSRAALERGLIVAVERDGLQWVGLLN